VAVFIVEVLTTTGKVCESYATYEEAKKRVEQFPAGALAGMPLIFEELVDSSQRVVREDGKPLQWHRQPEDELPGPDEPLALCEDAAAVLGAERRAIEREPDEPIPLCDDADALREESE
jgi:hypothetical protein